MTDITVLEGPEALASLKPDWDALWRRCAFPTPFLTHAWLTASWRHYAGSDRLRILCLRDGERLLGLAALRAKRSFGVERLLFAAHHADYCDLLIEADAEWEVLRAFVGWLAEEHRGWDLVRLRSVSVRSATDGPLPVLAVEGGLATCSVRADAAPYISLSASYEECLAALPGRGRVSGHVRKRRKLADQHGPVSTYLTTGPDLTPAVVSRFLELHRRGWEGRGGSAVVPDGRAACFHTDLATALASDGAARILWLSAGGHDVAAYYGFLVGDVFLAYIPAHNPDFAPYSPGGQMMLALIEYGIAEGWQEIDLMRGTERYKFDYTHRCAYTMDHTLARSPLKLRLFTASSALRGLFRR